MSRKVIFTTKMLNLTGLFYSNNIIWTRFMQSCTERKGGKKLILSLNITMNKQVQKSELILTSECSPNLSYTITTKHKYIMSGCV